MADQNVSDVAQSGTKEAIKTENESVSLTSRGFTRTSIKQACVIFLGTFAAGTKLLIFHVATDARPFEVQDPFYEQRFFILQRGLKLPIEMFVCHIIDL